MAFAGQDAAKKTMSVAVYNHYKRIHQNEVFTFGTIKGSVVGPWHFGTDLDAVPRIHTSVTLSSESRCGSGRPKDIRILRIRMRIRNTGKKS